MLEFIDMSEPLRAATIRATGIMSNRRGRVRLLIAVVEELENARPHPGPLSQERVRDERVSTIGGTIFRALCLSRLSPNRQR